MRCLYKAAGRADALRAAPERRGRHRKMGDAEQAAAAACGA
jgi:hypothetical protein